MRYLLVALLALCSTASFAQNFQVLHPNAIIEKYGKPDKIVSSEYEKPHPPIVTKLLEYKKEQVRYIFIPTAPMGNPPPYNEWKLMGTQDIKTQRKIEVADAEERLKSRLKKK